jgi:hypothetical protein
LGPYFGPTDLINDTETRYQLPRYRILRAEIEWIMINCLLQVDVAKLLVLGKQFAQRQRNRHMVGHEACLDSKIPKLFTSNL